MGSTHTHDWRADDQAPQEPAPKQEPPWFTVGTGQVFGDTVAELEAAALAKATDLVGEGTDLRVRDGFEVREVAGSIYAGRTGKRLRAYMRVTARRARVSQP